MNKIAAISYLRFILGASTVLLLTQAGLRAQSPCWSSGAGIVTTSCNVGIGTTSPEAPLQVNGLIAAESESGSLVYTGQFGQFTTTNAKQLLVGGAPSSNYVVLQGVEEDVAYNQNLALNPLGGNVGIGTTSPSVPLQVASVDGRTAFAVGEPYVSTDNMAGWGMQRFTDGNVYLDAKTITGGELIFRSGSGTETGYQRVWMAVNSGTGNVGIGTTNPQHLLHVAGTIGAEEVIVSSTGADYVFEPDYKLTPLSEVAAYVKENHHLPDIPSAAEGKEKGVSVGDMQAKLLANVEELTLHMIDAEARSKRLETENAELQRQAAEMRQRMEKLEAGAVGVK